MEEIKPDTIVVVAGKLMTVQRSDRRGGADGYQCSDGGAYTRFVSAWQVEPARIGANVCAGDKVRPPAWCCPLPHLRPDDLERVKAQS